MKLNLEAKTPEEEKIKAYLEANVSPMLADKINNGVRIQKDDKTLLLKLQSSNSYSPIFLNVKTEHL